MVALSLLLVAAGAVLTWAVTIDVAGIDLHSVGVILFVVGLVGLIVALVLTFRHEDWDPRGRRSA